MKLSKLKSMVLLAFASTALLTATARASAVVAPSSAADGDLILGVRSTGANSDKTIVVDLGPASTVTASTNTVTTGGLASALSAQFGSGWAARTDLAVGVIGTTGAYNTPAYNVFASKVSGAPWIAGSPTAQAITTNKVETMMAQLRMSTGSDVAVQPTSGTGSLNNWTVFTSVVVEFSLFSPLLEGNPSQALTLYQVANGTTSANLGAIKLNSDGTVTFTTASDVTAANTPVVLSFAASSVTATKGATSVSVTVNRTGGSLAVGASITGAGAAVPVSFTSGQTTATVSVPVTPNIAQSTITLGLANFTGDVAGSFTGTVSAGSPATEVVTIPSNSTWAPSLTVTSPTATAAVVGSAVVGTVNVAGSADDAIGIASVTINGTPATTTAAAVGVTFAGTASLPNLTTLNPVTIVATDLAGNTTTVVRYVKYTAQTVIGYSATGTTSGASALTTLIAGTSAAAKVFGTNLVLTAARFDHSTATASSAIFQGWLVAGNSTMVTGQILNITLDTALLTTPTIVAVYGASPFTSGTGGVTSGTYTGLITSDLGYTSADTTNGYVTTTVAANGALTGSLKLSTFPTATTNSYAFASTKIGPDGTVLFGTTDATALAFTRIPAGGATVLTMKFDFANRILTGKLYNPTAGTSSTITAYAQQTTATAGAYTFTMPGLVPTTYADGSAASYTASTFPQGTSIGNVIITAAGAATGSVTVADGSVSTFSTFLSVNNTVPMYGYFGTAAAPTGAALGTLTVTTGTSIAGSVTWFKRANAGFYSTGWTKGVVLAASGLPYVAINTAFVGATTLTPFDSLTFSAAGSNVTPVGPFNVKVAPSATAGPAYTMVTTADPYTVTAASPYLSGTAGPAASLIAKSYKGVVIQGTTNATSGVFGFWLSQGGASAAVTLQHP